MHACGLESLSLQSPLILHFWESPPWPKSLGEKSVSGNRWSGRAHDCTSQTEADQEQPCWFNSSMLSRQCDRPGHAYRYVGATKHYANLFCVVVGQTSRARKGTAWSETERFFQYIDADWLSGRLLSGLGSGEGLYLELKYETRPTPNAQPTKEGQKRN